MKSILITGANIVNEGRISPGDVLVKDGMIAKLGSDLSSEVADIHIKADGKYLFPGLIDDQVHFREPGLTHKGEIYTEAKTGVAGGATTYMEMPNTVPQSTSIKLLEEKYSKATEVSLANFSFFIGATNDNLEEILKVNPGTICGSKFFRVPPQEICWWTIRRYWKKSSANAKPSLQSTVRMITSLKQIWNPSNNLWRRYFGQIPSQNTI